MAQQTLDILYEAQGLYTDRESNHYCAFHIGVVFSFSLYATVSRRV